MFAGFDQIANCSVPVLPETPQNIVLVFLLVFRCIEDLPNLTKSAGSSVISMKIISFTYTA